MVLVSFAICWLPFSIVISLRAFNLSSRTLYKSTFFLALSNSGMNPLIYAWKNHDFRRAFKRLLRLQSPDKNDLNESFLNHVRQEIELKVTEQNEMSRRNSCLHHFDSAFDSYSVESIEVDQTTHM